MVSAPYALRFRNAVGKIRFAVRARGLDKPYITGSATEENEVFTHQANLFGGSLIVELSTWSKRVPIPS
jgi:hypothetical protein